MTIDVTSITSQRSEPRDPAKTKDDVTWFSDTVLHHWRSCKLHTELHHILRTNIPHLQPKPHFDKLFYNSSHQRALQKKKYRDLFVALIPFLRADNLHEDLLLLFWGRPRLVRRRSRHTHDTRQTAVSYRTTAESQSIVIHLALSWDFRENVATILRSNFSIFTPEAFQSDDEISISSITERCIASSKFPQKSMRHLEFKSERRGRW